MLERQDDNLKRLWIKVSLLEDYVFEIIERNCKNLEFLKICYFKMLLVSDKQTDMYIGNRLILKVVVIEELGVLDEIYFPSSLI